VLPLLPALAASSPLADGRLQPWRDYRMEVYRTNSARVPEVAGRVVPEPAFSEAEYRERVFAPMMRAMAPLDPEGVLEEEFLNSRGAIARFGRGSIEIRVIDVQECPLADVAIVAATVAALRALVEERWLGAAGQRAFETERLAAVLAATARDAERAEVDPALARALGRPGARTAGEVWRSLVEGAAARGELDAAFEPALEHILERGTLAARIVRSTGPEPDRARLTAVYRELADCLEGGRLFG
jgi:glutamate---cysteine ligase / carboxylate-amine ligase